MAQFVVRQRRLKAIAPGVEPTAKYLAFLCKKGVDTARTYDNQVRALRSTIGAEYAISEPQRDSYQIEIDLVDNIQKQSKKH